MAVQDANPADAGHQRSKIVGLLGDFERQYRALENAMAAFGDDFDLKQFKRAYNEQQDLEAYNRVQAVERALCRVQNYVAHLAVLGAKLAHHKRPAGAHAPDWGVAFEALRDDGVISGELCRRVSRAQRARSRIEHGCIEPPAGDVHAAARLVHATARDFVAAYGPWIAPRIA